MFTKVELSLPSKKFEVSCNYQYSSIFELCEFEPPFFHVSSLQRNM